LSKSNQRSVSLGSRLKELMTWFSPAPATTQLKLVEVEKFMLTGGEGDEAVWVLPTAATPV
jgi:hypothetical protein